jgi:hypothetical protein
MVGDHTGILGAVVFLFFLSMSPRKYASPQKPALKQQYIFERKETLVTNSSKTILQIPVHRMPLHVQSPNGPALNMLHGEGEKKEKRKSNKVVEQIFRTWA